MVVILAGLSTYTYYGAKNALEQQVLQNVGNAASSYSEMINGSLREKEALTAMLANVLGNRKLSNEDAIQFFRQVKASRPGVKSVFIGTEDKHYADSDGITEKEKKNYDPRTRGWYKTAMSSDGIGYTEVYEASQTKELSVSIVKKVMQGDKPIGVAGVDVDINGFQALAKDIHIGETGYAFILNEKGNFLYHPSFQLADNITEIDNGALTEYSKVFMSGKPAVQTGVFGGQEKVFASTPIGNSGWTLVAAVPKAEMFSQVHAVGMHSIIASIIGLLILGIIIFLVTVHIAKRMKQLDSMAAEVAGGNLAVDTAAMLKNASDDEIGELAQSFHNMKENLGKVIGQVRTSAEQLALSSGQLTANSQQSAQAGESVAQAIDNVAHGTEQQVAAVNDVSEIMESMSTTIEQVTATANGMANTATMTAQATANGQAAVDKAVRQMDNVGTGSRKAQSMADELEESSKQIGEIVGLISSIAGQTNLLALNAAIEAARAGEQGRGFAVVAEEVRKLAEQSEQAARQITELISKNHNSIGNVVGAIDAAIQDIDEGVQLVNGAGEEFKNIAQLVGEVAQQVKEISTSLEGLATGSQKIVTSVKNVEIASRDASGEVQTVSAAVEEQAASMQEIAASSQTLADLAKKLKTIVEKFNI
jgi:methyl-accepting chemotaxis protein